MKADYKIWDKDKKEFTFSSIEEILKVEEDFSFLNLNVKDLNGKDIYNGDILKCHDIIGFVGYEILDATFVIWVKDNIEQTFNRHSPGTNWHEWNIIGNKIENFDLLEFQTEEPNSESAV